MKLVLAFLAAGILFSPLQADHARFVRFDAGTYTPGFFSLFTSVLGLLDRYENNQIDGFIVDLKKTGLYYDPTRGSNSWNYYFLPLKRNFKNVPEQNVTHAKLGPLALHCLFRLSKERCHYLIKKYIHVRPHILEKVDSFVETHFKDHFVLGVHYRGTDKMQTESPPVEYDDFFDTISRFIFAHEGKPIILFVASDEKDFIREMTLRFPDQMITTNASRSESGLPVHLQMGNNYQKGEEALLDCLLLSRCDHLIRTSSNLSLCATFFNPNIPTLLINPGHFDP